MRVVSSNWEKSQKNSPGSSFKSFLVDRSMSILVLGNLFVVFSLMAATHQFTHQVVSDGAVREARSLVETVRSLVVVSQGPSLEAQELVRRIDADLQKNAEGVRLRTLPINPFDRQDTQGVGGLDDFQRQALRQLHDGKAPSFSTVSEYKGEMSLRYAVLLTGSEDSLGSGLLLEVLQPLGTIRAAIDNKIYSGAGILLGMSGLGLWFLGAVFRRLRSLRDHQAASESVLQEQVQQLLGFVR